MELWIQLNLKQATQQQIAIPHVSLLNMNKDDVFGWNNSHALL